MKLKVPLWLLRLIAGKTTIDSIDARVPVTGKASSTRSGKLFGLIAYEMTISAEKDKK